MGNLKKSAVETIVKTVTFIIGAPIDDTRALKAKLQDIPMFGIEPWSPGRGVKYQHFWNDVFHDPGSPDFITIMIVFRVNKGSYDLPHFFHIDKFGLRELVSTRTPRVTERQRAKRSDPNHPIETVQVINEGWDLKWEVVSYKPWDCQYCGQHVETCIKEKVCFNHGICRDCGLVLAECKCNLPPVKEGECPHCRVPATQTGDGKWLCLKCGEVF
jgi:hypothetical protein